MGGGRLPPPAVVHLNVTELRFTHTAPACEGNRGGANFHTQDQVPPLNRAGRGSVPDPLRGSSAVNRCFGRAPSGPGATQQDRPSLLGSACGPESFSTLHSPHTRYLNIPSTSFSQVKLQNTFYGPPDSAGSCTRREDETPRSSPSDWRNSGLEFTSNTPILGAGCTNLSFCPRVSEAIRGWIAEGV